MMKSSKILRHFEFFLMKQKIIMLVIMHAKFEVNSFCAWYFRQGAKFTPPFMLKRYHGHLMHNRVKGLKLIYTEIYFRD